MVTSSIDGNSTCLKWTTDNDRKISLYPPSKNLKSWLFNFDWFYSSSFLPSLRNAELNRFKWIYWRRGCDRSGNDQSHYIYVSSLKEIYFHDAFAEFDVDDLPNNQLPLPQCSPDEVEQILVNQLPEVFFLPSSNHILKFYIYSFKSVWTDVFYFKSFMQLQILSFDYLDPEYRRAILSNLGHQLLNLTYVNFFFRT